MHSQDYIKVAVISGGPFGLNMESYDQHLKGGGYE